MPNTEKSTVIVGGGISGILLALRLSKDFNPSAHKITLIEKQAQLGGRLFFSPTYNLINRSSQPEKISAELYENARLNKHISGPGFEIMNASSLNVLLRHIESHLTEEEKNELENCTEKNISHQCFFVRKSFVSVNELLSGSSEILTKKEAETLKSFVYNFYNPNQEKDETDSLQNEPVCEKSKKWLELSKPNQEALTPLFTSIIGINWEKSSFHNVCKALWNFFSSYKETISPIFYRSAGIEFILENILRKRGVHIRTLCQVLQVRYSKEHKFQLNLSDEIEPSNKTLHCDNLVLAIPLIKCLDFLPKEYFSAAQSRLITKTKPVSLVFLELSHFSNLKSEICSAEFQTGDRLVFPVEKAQAFLSHNDRMLIFTELNYEESLEAPAVREAVAKLRKSAARIVKTEIAEEMKKGARIPQNKVIERIVLLPVGYSIPLDAPQNLDVKETKMGLPGLYCCGDSLTAFSDEPWKRIVNCVNEVTKHVKES